MTFRDLEQRAIEAHLAGRGWASFWPTVRDDVVRMAGADPGSRRRLVERLLCILVSGEDSGLEPIGSGASPWELETES